MENGSRNHEMVPVGLIASIAGLRGGGSHKVLSELLRKKLVDREAKNHCKLPSLPSPLFFSLLSIPPYSSFYSIPPSSVLSLRNEDEGFRLTYGGYDFLALKTFAKREVLYSVGNQIGVGKESGKKTIILW